MIFLLTPLREGRPETEQLVDGAENFYSRPCGRGDIAYKQGFRIIPEFLLTPLREGRPRRRLPSGVHRLISTHAPAGGATPSSPEALHLQNRFLLTPLREGRLPPLKRLIRLMLNFYSRPCGRGDLRGFKPRNNFLEFLLTPLREGRRKLCPDGGQKGVFLLTPLREGRPCKM